MKEKNKRTKDRIFTIFLFLGLSFTAFSQTGPKVVATGPAANALDVDNTATIGLTFSEAMDAATLNAANIKISGNCGPPLGFPAPGVTGATAVLDPDRDFFPGEVITATLTVGAASSTGNPLANPFTYRFTAGVNPDSPGEFPYGKNTIGITTRRGVNDLTTADLDGDGDLDVLSAAYDENYISHITWYENDGSGNFGDRRNIGAQLDFSLSVTTADLDGDGDLDVLSASINGPPGISLPCVTWYENDGNGNFGGQRTIATKAGGAYNVTTGDLDGDGDLDVLSTFIGDYSIAWYGNDGDGNFNPQRTITTAADRALGVATGDLDGDGDLDVLSVSSSDDRIAWYQNDGLGNFDGLRTITTAADIVGSVTTADLDGDGDLDVLPTSLGGDRIVGWYENDGSGNFGQRAISGAAEIAREVTTADLDGDGDLDVLSAFRVDDRIAWYENDGNGNFGGLRTIAEAADIVKSVTTGDLDGDGDLDVLSASFDDKSIAWYENAVPLAANCTAPFTLPLDASGTVSITAADIDNGSTGAAGMDIDITDLDCSDLGANTVTLTVTNASGATDSCTTIVTVEDSITPVPDMADLPDVTGECRAAITVMPTATDNCAGTITATTNDPLEYDEQGSYTVTWTYGDGNGNTSEQIQNVIVEDVAPPLPDMAILPDVRGECSATVMVTPTATDNCAGTVTATTNDPLAYDAQGTFTVTWSYDDGNGNTGTQEQTVIIEDVAPPVPDMAVLPEVRGECSATVTVTPTATDNCAGTIIATTNDPLEYDAQGTFTVIWTYGDGNGNTGTQVQTVIVEDIAPPIVIVRDITVELDENGRATIAAEDIDNGSTDNCGIAELSLDTAVFDCPELGDTNVELTVTDLSGNSHSATATVTFTARDDNLDGEADVCSLEASIIPGRGVSPNGDGINDTWTIGNISDFPEALVKIFDRNGREVFSTGDYRNDWGGTQGTGGKLLPVGSYYYVVHLQRPSIQNVTGWLYLNY